MAGQNRFIFPRFSDLKCFLASNLNLGSLSFAPFDMSCPPLQGKTGLNPSSLLNLRTVKKDCLGPVNMGGCPLPCLGSCRLRKHLSFLLSPQHSVLRNALFCLETASQRRDIHIYTLSMMAYAFSLAGKEEKREEALRILDERAVKGADGTLHWERPDKPEHRNDFPFYEHRASSAEVEITSYVMLAIITRHPEPTKEELEKAALCVKWLSKQQNPNGGFSSTQDTVVALEALSKYAGFIFSKGKLAAQVTLISGGNNLAQVHVDNSNRILLQCHPLPTVPGEYDVQVTGHGCTYLQTTLKYNVHLHQEHAPFQLAVDITSKNCDSYNYKTFNLTVSISYTGPRLVSNMAIVDVKMLSGFVADKPSVRKLETNRHIMRTEVSSDRVLLYVDQLTNMTQTYSFDMQQEIIVENLKPALVTVYDYYVLEESANAQYTNPCDSGMV
uniref:Alpha-macroglobulin receptor-binding domain-containing protein n=1 Tax=Varanus komodoensis TaxID=61221 RepID=A0A8D2ISW1_VARKO